MRACFLFHLDAAYASSYHRAISSRKHWCSYLTGPSAVFASETQFPTTFGGCSRLKQSSLSRSSPISSLDLLESSRSCIRSSVQLKSMAAAKSQLLSKDFIAGYGLPRCEGILQTGKPRGIFFHDSNRARHCQRAGMTLRSYRRSHAYLSYGFALNEFPMKDVLTTPVRSISYSRCHSNGLAPDISLTDDQLGSADSTSQKKADLGLISGAWYMPHPDKEKTGGEDAYFICEDQGVIGVADGVGGWAEYGIDSGEYSRGLMSNAVSSIKEESSGGFIDPAKILEKAHSVTRFTGSCTACIIALTDQGIHAINLGDSGFLVIRDGSTVFRSHSQQYEFNFPYQLGSDTACEPPSSGEILKCSVQAGDVIVAGTDGLFDNLYNNEIVSIVVHAKRVHLKPQEMAKNIATLARERAVDRNRETPFSTAAREAGFRYYGGKLDDITVVVSYVASTSNK